MPQAFEGGKSSAVLAKMAGVGETTVKQARKVAEKGTAEQKEAVRSGKSSAKAVSQEIEEPKKKKSPDPWTSSTSSLSEIFEEAFSL